MSKPTPEHKQAAEDALVKALGRVSEQAMGKWLWSNLNKSIAQLLADRDDAVLARGQEMYKEGYKQGGFDNTMDRLGKPLPLDTKQTSDEDKCTCADGIDRAVDAIRALRKGE